MNFFLYIFWNYIFFIIYYNIVMSSEIIQSVAYDNYDNFEHAISYFH
jgi:hypothetical protein